MKITKRQLRRIIKEVVSAHSESLPDHRGDDEFEDSEHKRGYQDALDGLPMADNATAAYDDGYETAASEIEADQKAAEEILSTRMGSYRGTTLPRGKRIK